MRHATRLGALALVAFLWAPAARAQEEAPAAAAPAVAPAPAHSAFSLVLAEGKRLSSRGKFYDAALIYNRILSEGEEAAAYFQEAQYEMGVALFSLQFYVSAFGYFDRVVETGPSHVRYAEALPWLVKIHREIPGETNTLFRMASYPADRYPIDMAEEISFYVGQYHYYEGNLDAALESLSRVGASKPDLFVKAMYLKGVVLVRRNEPMPASDAFREVLRFVKDAGPFEGRGKYKEMSTLALARVFYGAGFNKDQFIPGNVETAIRFYDQIPETSDQWLDSLFEKSWAFYQVGNFSRALGNILTINSPYFEEEYYPEAWVLRAVIFFKNCRYDEALATIDPFYKEYYEIHKELENVLAGHTDPTDFYQYLASLSKKGGAYSLKIKKIFNAALADAKLRRLFGFVVTISKEIQQLDALKTSPIAKRLVDFLMPDLLAYRSLTMSEAGQLARERLARVRGDLKKLLSQALKVRFECLNAQKGILEEQVRKQQVSSTGPSAPKEDFEVDKEHIYWVWDGEYWKDELGSYHYPLTSACGELK